MTLRDEVWDEALTKLKRQGRFKISDLPFDDSERHTVRRTLRNMEDAGWLQRDSEQSPVWRLGSKAELILEADDELVERSRS